MQCVKNGKIRRYTYIINSGNDIKNSDNSHFYLNKILQMID